MNNEKDKLPESIEFEDVVIGAILIEKDAINEVADILIPEHFYKTENVVIYKAIFELYNANKPIDLLTVADKLRYNGDLDKIGGSYYLSQLTNKVGSSANIEYHSKIIVQEYLFRKTIEICYNTIDKAEKKREDVFDIINELSYNATMLNTFDILNAKSINYIHEKKIKPNILQDKATGTLFRSKLGLEFLSKTSNVIAGFQGTGKTALLLHLAKEFSENHVVAVLSMEMSEEMLTSRIIQSFTNVFAKKIITNELTDFEKEKIFELKLSDNIIVDDSTNITDRNVGGKLKALVNRYQCKIVFIDYVQLIDVEGIKGENDVKKMERLTKLLQNLAKDLDICVVVLAQLARSNDRPTAQSLRGGGIEQSASNIYILYDPNWKANDGVKWENIEKDKGLIELIDAKNRYSGVENKLLYFDKPKQSFSKWYGDISIEEKKEEKNDIF